MANRKPMPAEAGILNQKGGFLMSSEAQILANRRNAQESRGPQAADGKAIVSQNAVRHGLSARQDVIRSESQAEFDHHRGRMLADLAPIGPMESMLAERIVGLSWRLRRAGRIQNQAIDALNAGNTSGPLAKITQSLLSGCRSRLHGEPGPCDGDLALGRMASKDFANARVLERLLMYERRIEHSLYRAIVELQRLRLIRKLDPAAGETDHETWSVGRS